MEPLTKLLARIDSKLNLILPIVAQYQTQIPTVVARLKIAQIHNQEKDVKELFFDLEWITRNLLGRKALSKKFEGFEHQILDLHLLKEDLRNYLSLRQSGDALEEAIALWRKKLLRSFEAVEHDLLMIKEKTENEKVFSFELGRTIRDFLMSEEILKQKLWKLEVKEGEIIQLFSYLGEEIKNINSFLLGPRKIVILQALRKVLLQDWNELVGLMVVVFAKAYPESRPAGVVRAVKREDVRYLEFQS